MPRRKRRTTRPLHLDVPALAEAVAHATEHDMEAADHLFKIDANGNISPRSIRNSLEETNVDMDGHVRQRKGSVSISWGAAATTNGALAQPEGSESSNGRPSSDESTASTTALAVIGPAEPDFHEDEEPPLEYSPNVPASDAALAQLTGAQLWVHRVLAMHHHTLRVLGLELEAFPNTRLSLKQLEAVMSPVISMCNMMTPAHFGIREPSPTMARTMTEVHYWKLWESDTIDIGIFFMPPGGVIPLHNHPGMSVITRVLYGSANVTSYDLLPKSELSHLPADEVQAGRDDIKWARVSRQGDFVAECTMWLDPRRFNLHQIRANDQIGCALLDIMIPPYNNSDRDCHHFEILVERFLEKNNDRIVKLLESVQPDNHNEPSGSSPPTQS